MEKSKLTPGNLTKEGYNAALKLMGSSYDGWCKITPLSGDYEEGIFMATFTDDSRLIFEANDNEIRLMLTKDQQFTFLENSFQEEYELQMASIIKYTWELLSEHISDIKGE